MAYWRRNQIEFYERRLLENEKEVKDVESWLWL
jgi:hypothetical protein